MPFLSFPPKRRLGAVLAVTGLAAILVATLFPNPRQAASSAATPLLCIVCGEAGGADVFLNLLLFTPMATGLRLLDWPGRRVVAAAALLSFAVEYLQFAVVAGRDPSLSDLLANTTGAAVAAALTPHWLRLLTPDPVLARRLFLAAAALFLGVLVVSALGLRPGVRPGRLWSACTAYSPVTGEWTGTLGSVVLNGDTLPCDRELADTTAIRAALGAGRTTLAIDALSGAPTGGRALVYGVGMRRATVFALSQEGSAALFSVPSVSQRLRLFPPTIRLDRAFPSKDGIPIELRAGQQGRRIWISSSYPGQRRYAEMTLSPAFGWSTLIWWRLQPGSRLRQFTALWLGALIFPAAYWGGFMRHPASGRGGVAAALGGGLAVLPAITGYPPVHWSEWMGGCLGVALGWALHRLAAYLQSRCGSPSTSAYSSS